ncbi:MAG TPA: SRPBCC family protein [Anaeromyxobacteraceae bacterium]|nr:SRPBCC family protein [Anaeromyxobacteraceae bacterium]
MIEFGKLKVSADGDRGIVMSRVFDAPREVVFEAYVRPELVQHWLGVGGGWEMAVCIIEPRVGGTWRFVWNGPKGEQMGWRGVCRELTPPERIKTVDSFDQPWFQGTEVGTLAFSELGSRTLLTATLEYETREARDSVLASPMAEGMAASYDRLAGILEAPADQWMDQEAGVP